MRRLRILLLLVGTVAAAVVGAAPAGAHATFVGTPTTFYVGTLTGLVLNVPHELEPQFYNVEIALQIPAGWEATSCISKPTWECGIAVEDGHQVIRWIKTGAPGDDETFEFWSVTANTVGSFAFPTVQWYSNGHESAWVGPPGSEAPAPVLTTIPRDVPPPTTPVTPPTTQGSPGAGGSSGTGGGEGPARPTNPAGPGLAAPATTPDGEIIPFPDFGPRSTTTVRRTTVQPSASAGTDDEAEDDERFAPRRSPRQESGRGEPDDEGIEAALTSGSFDGGGGIPPGLFLIPALLLAVALAGGLYSWRRRPVDQREPR